MTSFPDFIASRRASVTRIILGLLLLAATADSARAQTLHSCLPATSSDSTAQSLRQEAVGILTDSTWSEFRARHGISAGIAADVSIVQDNVVCGAAMAAFEALAGRTFADSFVIVQMGHTSPFYLITPRVEGAMAPRYLLNSQFAVLEVIKS